MKNFCLVLIFIFQTSLVWGASEFPSFIQPSTEIPEARCNDLAVAKLKLTVRQAKLVKESARDPDNYPQPLLKLSKPQEHNFRSEIIRSLEKNEFHIFLTSTNDGISIKYLLDALSADPAFSLQILNELGREHWLAAITASIQSAGRYDNSWIDRVFFALPNHEVQLLGRARNQALVGVAPPPSIILERSSWLHLDTNSYNTSYNLFHILINALELPEASVLVDMGSGLGRMGMIVGSYYPNLKYVGYEYHGFRMEPAVATAKTLDFQNVSFVQADFSSPELNLVDGDVFFFYYPNSSSAVMTAALEKVHQIALKKKIQIVARMQIGNIDNKKLSWLKPPRRLQVGDDSLLVYESQ
jgi:hypothetical protein